MLITFDQQGLIRFHKLRGIKVLQRYDFAEDWENLDYVFTNSVETTRIELKIDSNEEEKSANVAELQ